ncbi:hypothetical protein VC83_01977 [Pseudogymnoascus destructans]|uniref:Uncharacterized protein n=2 Tax=Pseudogymnoascus destructans TaxID=655981 RepID=L8FU91_PSED2|nr:uncharacterized protein VC83_01977 [Pseudogymnoascus destructans]ELR04462.1 hypothetical protein GMDG_06768 [Pseudogymnoascus destructans 20631-21]OAF61494.1 hypothetical protein VC83_01977 [Pseudogymnoascus destructans]
MFASKHIMFAEDGDSVAQLGVICSEAYLKETFLPAVVHDVVKAEKFYNKKSAAVLSFLVAIARPKEWQNQA